jgi:hypothetical protein
MTEETDAKRFDTAQMVVMSGWSLTILVCLCIIGAAVYQAVFMGPIESALKDWAGMCLGFLLGSFVSLVKDFITASAPK